jgi:acetyl-CoA decarbonylase/synthase complex subunit gamma
MNYKADPGLYALGEPDDKAPVVVTANYKMSFDALRKALPGRNAWILVLDTDGVNVWCAAGKGTFSTGEVVKRVQSSGLADVLSRRQLILPQLSAPGVAAHEVKKLSGFRVIYGPVRSRDLPSFIDSGYEATPQMRLKTFDIWERMVVIPVELVAALKWALILLVLFFFAGGLGGSGGYWSRAVDHGLFTALALATALVAGTILTPILLPWLPGRAFSMKGLILGLAAALILIILRSPSLAHWSGRLEVLAWFFLIPAITAYLAMNFTGASTYTSLSGVKQEMRWAVPVEIATACLGVILWIGSRMAA